MTDAATGATPGRGHNRDGAGRYTRNMDTAARDAEACRLRSRGLTLQQIADRLGFADRSNARRAISRALAQVVRENAEDLVTLQLEQLDALSRAAWAVLEAEHYVVSGGRVVYGPDGEPLRDDGPTLAAIDRLLRVQERRARLLGLDAPARSRVEVLDEGTVDRAIAELEAEIVQRERQKGIPR